MKFNILLFIVAIAICTNVYATGMVLYSIECKNVEKADGSIETLSIRKSSFSAPGGPVYRSLKINRTNLYEMQMDPSGPEVTGRSVTYVKRFKDGNDNKSFIILHVRKGFTLLSVHLPNLGFSTAGPVFKSQCVVKVLRRVVSKFE